MCRAGSPTFRRSQAATESGAGARGRPRRCPRGEGTAGAGGGTWRRKKLFRSVGDAAQTGSEVMLGLSLWAGLELVCILSAKHPSAAGDQWSPPCAPHGSCLLCQTSSLPKGHFPALSLRVVAWSGSARAEPGLNVPIGMRGKGWSSSPGGMERNWSALVQCPSPPLHPTPQAADRFDFILFYSSLF